MIGIIAQSPCLASLAKRTEAGISRYNKSRFSCEA